MPKPWLRIDLALEIAVVVGLVSTVSAMFFGTRIVPENPEQERPFSSYSSFLATFGQSLGRVGPGGQPGGGGL